MDAFPDDINMKACYEVLSQNQFELIKNVRQQFYNEIKENLTECKKISQLTFPEKLWSIHREKIICELLERFGKLKVITSHFGSTACTLVQVGGDIPNNVGTIVIEYASD